MGHGVAVAGSLVGMLGGRRQPHLPPALGLPRRRHAPHVRSASGLAVPPSWAYHWLGRRHTSWPLLFLGHSSTLGNRNACTQPHLATSPSRPFLPSVPLPQAWSSSNKAAAPSWPSAPCWSNPQAKSASCLVDPPDSVNVKLGPNHVIATPSDSVDIKLGLSLSWAALSYWVKVTLGRGYGLTVTMAWVIRLLDSSPLLGIPNALSKSHLAVPPSQTFPTLGRLPARPSPSSWA